MASNGCIYGEKVGQYNFTMGKQPRKSRQDLKTTGNIQGIAEMLSEVVFQYEKYILNEVLKTQWQRGKGFTKGFWSSFKSLGTGAVNYKKVTSKIQVNYKKEQKEKPCEGLFQYSKILIWSISSSLVRCV